MLECSCRLKSNKHLKIKSRVWSCLGDEIKTKYLDIAYANFISPRLCTDGRSVLYNILDDNLPLNLHSI